MDPASPALVGCIVVLAGALARVTRQRAEQKKKDDGFPPRDYPTTTKELEDFVDGRIYHRRGSDLAHARFVVEHLAAGEGQEAIEAFDRLTASTQPAPRLR